MKKRKGSIVEEIRRNRRLPAFDGAEIANTKRRDLARRARDLIGGPERPAPADDFPVGSVYGEEDESDGPKRRRS